MRAEAVVCLLGSTLLFTACGSGGSGTPASPSPTSMAAALGCSQVEGDHRGRDYERETCVLDGTRLSIWWQSHSGAGRIRDVPPWVHSVVGGAGWFVGCEQVAECRAVRDQVGGVITGPTGPAG